MFPQRSITRFATTLRSPAVRSQFQRRFASTENSAFKGAEDNAFNRERKAVKDHAAATSGTCELGWQVRGRLGQRGQERQEAWGV